MALQFSNSLDMLTGTSPSDLSVGVTVDTTGPAIDVSLRQLKSIQFKADVTSGNGVFTIEVCNGDPSIAANWLAYNRLTTNVTNTNAQTDARVASVTLSSDTTAFVFFPIGDYFRYIRCKVDQTTDGTYFAYLEAA